MTELLKHRRNRSRNMHKFVPMALAAMLAMNTSGVLASEKSPQIVCCIVTILPQAYSDPARTANNSLQGQCTNDIRNRNFRTEYGCNSADDKPCLCKNSQYLTDIGDCAGASPAEVREDLIADGHLCARRYLCVIYPGFQLTCYRVRKPNS